MKITQRIMAIYLVGFILFAGLAIFTVLSGKKIQATTTQLAQEEVPGLIAVSAYKTYLQRQSIQLYELYATADYAMFEKTQKQAKEKIEPYVQRIKQLPQYEQTKPKVEAFTKQQEEFTQKFINIMRRSVVDWDGARGVLTDFSQVSEKMDAELDVLVVELAQNTKVGATQSTKQTEALINTALLLTLVSFVIGFFAAYDSHAKITRPLQEVSDVLTGIAARKDLTYRVKQYSKDEVGDIASAANTLLDEFQRLARALDSSTQELNSTAKHLIAASDETYQDAQSNQQQMGNIKVMSGKLQGLAENLQAQFRLLNF